MDYEYKNYHDNRAFQFHNNNTLTKGKNAKATTKTTTKSTKIYSLPIHDANALDVVVVQSKDGSSNYAGGKLLETFPNHKNNGICKRKDCAGNEKTSSVCSRHHRRRKHNATQTPLTSSVGWQQLGDDGSCSGIAIGGGLTCPSCLSICTMSSCVKHSHCFHHGEQHIGAGAGLAELTCHCHITHHCHQYSPSGQSSKKCKHQNQRQCRHHASKRPTTVEQCGQTHHQHHQQHHRQNRHSKEQQQQQYSQHHHQHCHSHHQKHSRSSPSAYAKELPAVGGSFKSSNESLRQSQCQEIAIEIDAATMTEDNGSTATSNFAYKIAKDHKENRESSRKYGEKLVPYNCRRASFNSNTTIETDELSRDDADYNAVLGGQHDDDEVAELTPRRGSARTENNSSTTPRAICCDLDEGSCLEEDADGIAYCPYGVPLSTDVHNECVRIKRKRFLPHEVDFCSSCSSCSCARCDDNTSSCSSLDDDDDDVLGDYMNASAAEDSRPTHEFTVSAECHHCNLPRKSSSGSTMGEAADDEEDEQQDRNDRRIISTRSISSAHTSRRSSESFCSCNSTSYNYCSCSCDECDTNTTGRMRTAREEGLSNATDATQDLDEQHSSTLTPLTNPSSLVSTPLAEDAAGDLTIRSGHSNVFAADDASSLSQSAEYFSVASSNQQTHDTPKITPVHKPLAKSSKASNTEYADDTMPPPVKQCKHYSKHHRHKKTETKQDGYL